MTDTSIPSRPRVLSGMRPTGRLPPPTPRATPPSTPNFVPPARPRLPHVTPPPDSPRRFNALYCSLPTPAIEKARADHSDKEIIAAEIAANNVSAGILPEPKVLLTPSPKLPGLDGRKMSKSYNNTIMLTEPEADVRAKLKTMVTDPSRVRRTDPGNPDVCPVFDLTKVF